MTRWAIYAGKEEFVASFHETRGRGRAVAKGRSVISRQAAPCCRLPGLIVAWKSTVAIWVVDSHSESVLESFLHRLNS